MNIYVDNGSEAGDNHIDVGHYYVGEAPNHKLAGIHICVQKQFYERTGVPSDDDFSKTIWIHRDCLPELYDAIGRFLRTGSVESEGT